MKRFTQSLLVAMSLGLAACSLTPKTASQNDQQRVYVRQVTNQTLEHLYKANPSARAAVAKSAGYAVFSDIGFKFGVLGGAKGEGLAVNNATGEQTFMRMVELQPGLGIGANSFRTVFVFERPASLSEFVNSGWAIGANVMAAAKSKKEGGAYSGAIQVAPGVHLYQFTQEGLIVGVSVTGAKYYKDPDLN
ncbi:MAG: hypothetical protein K1X53_15695 [Candidatus Sumerlaeaceae bacterium]|nr:hypothetical protein [Candidatus Sumerlaeaceae bacterium]